MPSYGKSGSGRYTPRGPHSSSKFDNRLTQRSGGGSRFHRRKQSHQPTSSQQHTPLSSDKKNKLQHLLKGSSSRPAENFEGSLPHALGQSLTPSHIKIQANQVGDKRRDGHGSTIAKARADAKYSPVEKHQLYQGSPQNPDNIGLQTSPVKIIRLNQAKNKKSHDVAAQLEANLKKNTIQNQL